MKPKHYKLPKKFKEYYSGQHDLAMQVACSTEKFCILNAPPGIGKTLVYMTVAKALDYRTLVLVGTKALQEQIMDDGFKKTKLIKGAGNYICKDDRDLKCNDGKCRVGIPCSYRDDGCFWFDAVRKAEKAKIVVANYAHYISLGLYSDPGMLGDFDLLIMDEAHSAIDWLTGFFTVTIEQFAVEELGMDWFNLEDLDAWLTWSADVVDYVTESLRVQWRPPHIRSRLVQLSIGVQILDKYGIDTKWIIDKREDRVVFTPIWPKSFTEDYLFKRFEKVILCSATISKDDVRHLGIDKSECEFISVPSPFDSNRSPIIYVPSVRVDYRMTTDMKMNLVKSIDIEISKRKDRKGILLTRSYDYARMFIMWTDVCGSDLHFPASSSELGTVICNFRMAEAPALLVSPSIGEGLDFPGFDASYVMILKVPFPDKRNPLLAARMKSDRRYWMHLIVRELVQYSGRGTRSRTDACDVLIFDSNFQGLGLDMFPRDFRKRFVCGVRRPVNLEGVI